MQILVDFFSKAFPRIRENWIKDFKKLSFKEINVFFIFRFENPFRKKYFIVA